MRQAQVCAAGAILNVLGPVLGSEGKENPKRAALKKLLSLALTVGLLHGSIRDVQSLREHSTKGSMPEQT